MIRRRWRRLIQRATRVGQVGWRGHALLAEATLRLAAARIAIATVPFSRIAREMGGLMPPVQAGALAAERAPSVADEAVAREIGWAVTCAARYLPFRAVCLPQAIAAHAMLKKRGIFGIVHFGTARGEAEGKTLSLEAHAWLNAGDVEVTGYPVEAGFTEIACIA